MNQPPPQKPRKGCLFYGCLTAAILAVALLVGGGIGVYVLKKKVDAFVTQYAATEPQELPALRYTDADLEQFKERLKVFTDGLRAGKPTEPLVLKGEDLNMLLAASPDLKKFADGVRLSVDGEQIRGKVSLKLGDLGAPFYQDRYLNGEVAIKASLQDGKLKVAPTEILVNGKALPDEFMSSIRDQNFAEGADQNPEFKASLDKLDAIEVSDGAIQVVPKPTE